MRGMGADVDDDRPVLAAFAQAFRNCVHVAATRVRVVGVQILQPECFDLELAHFAGLLPKFARARDGVVTFAGRGRRPTRVVCQSRPDLRFYRPYPVGSVEIHWRDNVPKGSSGSLLPRRRLHDVCDGLKPAGSYCRSGLLLTG